jgi:hypothetical protein
VETIFKSAAAHLAAQAFIGAVWVFHGLYSKLLNRIPRHRRIVARILGDRLAPGITRAIGAAEVLLGVWVWIGWQPIACASIQTVALLAMNTLEILRAKDLLISAPGMVVLNLCFVGLIWWWAS